MASQHDVAQRVLWLKSKLSSNPPLESSKIIKLLQKLSRLPVDVEILQETGIGKCVNGLKKKCPELAVYTKPLIQSWKSLVQTAMQAEAEEQQNNSIEENGEHSNISDDEEDTPASSNPSTPGGSPERQGDESDNYSGSPAYRDSSPERGSGSQSSSPERKERVNERSKKKDVPPTPIPWSPGKKIFPPYIPKKKPDDDKSHSIKSEASRDFKKVKKENNCNDIGGSYKQESEFKGNKSATKLEEGRNDGSSATVRPSVKHKKNPVKLPPLILKSVDKQSKSLKTGNKQPVTTNILLNEKLTPKSQLELKRNEKAIVKDKSKKKVERSDPKENKTTESNDSSLFQSGDRFTSGSQGGMKRTEKQPVKNKPKVKVERSDLIETTNIENDDSSSFQPDDRFTSGSPGRMKQTGKPSVKNKAKVKVERSDLTSSSDEEDDDSSLFQPDVPKIDRKFPKSPKSFSPWKSKHEKQETKRDDEQSSIKKEKKCLKEGGKVKKEAISSSGKDAKHRIEHNKKQSSESKETKTLKISSASGGKVIKSERERDKVENDRTKSSKHSSKKSVDHTQSSHPPEALKVSKQDGPQERNFENTGMSFGACLFGDSPPVRKKSKVTSGSHTKGSGQTQQRRDKPAKDAGKSQKHLAPKSRKDDKSRVRKEEKQKIRNESKGQRESTTKKRKSVCEVDSARSPEKKVKKSQYKDHEIKEASSSEVDMSLPEIHPDYKPTPRLPEIRSPEKKKTLESTHLSSQWFGSKQTKTKVYSGKVRKRNWSSLPSLQEICKEVIFDNIEALYDTGGVPFFLLEDILEKCNPQQLLKIEDYNPSYILESDHLWKNHVNRNFKGCEPDEMENWRELYLRKNDERDYKLLAITASITAAQAKKETGRLTKLAFVDSAVKPPRNVIRQQLRHGTSSSSVPVKAPRPRKELPGEPSSHRIIPSIEPPSPVRKQRTAKVVAPMMQKSLKLMKRVTQRR